MAPKVTREISASRAKLELENWDQREIRGNWVSVTNFF